MKKRINRNNIIKLVYNFVLIPLFIIILMFIWYAVLNNIKLETVNIKLSFFTLIILDLINLIILFLVKKTNRSWSIIIILLILLSLINQYKIIYSNAPLFVSDINFIQNYNNIGKFTSSNFLQISAIILKKSVVFFLLFAIIIGISFKLKIEYKRKNIRWSSLGSLIIICIFMIFSSSCKNEILNVLYKSKVRELDRFYSYKVLYGYYGIIGGMYYQYLNSLVNTKPKNYDKNKLEKIEQEIEMPKLKIDDVNIYIILAESFFDVQKLSDNIVFDKEVTKNFNTLKKQGKLIEIISPVFGSMTSNVSFELLMGTNMSYFGEGYVPFLDLDNFSKKPSLVRELKKEGYKTTLIMGEDSYNSEKIMKSIGFSTYKLANNEKYNKGNYVSDEYLGNLLIKKMSKEKQFIMLETMQSHLPYPINKYTKYDIKIKKSNLDKKNQETLLSYAQGIKDTDKMLKKVYEQIKKKKEKSILIFFGDHLPILKNEDGTSVYDKLDYFNTKNELINTYRKYNTEALILSNFNLDIKFNKYSGYDMLLNNIVNHLNIKIDPYFNFIYRTNNKLPAYNRYIAVDKNGKIININKLKKEDKEIIELREQMVYKEFIDKNK